MFFFFFIISCYHDDWCNEVNDVYSELSSVATNCHRKSETSDPGPISLIIAFATLRVSWDLRVEETNTGVGAGMKNGLLTAVYPGFITLTSPMATYTPHRRVLSAAASFYFACCNYFLLSGHPETSARWWYQAGFVWSLRKVSCVSHHAHIQSLLSNNIFLARCNFLDG